MNIARNSLAGLDIFGVLDGVGPQILSPPDQLDASMFFNTR